MIILKIKHSFFGKSVAQDLDFIPVFILGQADTFPIVLSGANARGFFLPELAIDAANFLIDAFDMSGGQLVAFGTFAHAHFCIAVT